VLARPKVGGPHGGAFRGLLAYNVPITIFLIYLGVRGQPVRWALWPGVAIHAIITILLPRALLVGAKSLRV